MGGYPNRRLARECVLQALYAHELAGGHRKHIIATLVKPPLGDDALLCDFAEDLFNASLDSSKVADRLLEKQSKNWKTQRMALLDRLILRMAICELLQFEDIPPKVTLNEAIDIAKRYSTERSGVFVNGVLNGVVGVLHRSGDMSKTGRGLKGIESIEERHRAIQSTD